MQKLAITDAVHGEKCAWFYGVRFSRGKCDGEVSSDVHGIGKNIVGASQAAITMNPRPGVMSVQRFRRPKAYGRRPLFSG